ncbi:MULTISPECIES: hypothetical protein [Paenibacillus]|uniref:hypothetical protein n=1 Tax=Paenibacillus TaxID=44249 RepID=UPI0022B8A89E|nr:hypothetical protein [Paenibacillus caseinilyticus]MCZ8518168.1 hypothetical protein [Paenibacillus caseinilyticus]
MSRQVDKPGARRPNSAELSDAGTSTKKNKKVIALTSEGKEVEGVVVFERKANYDKPSFA